MREEIASARRIADCQTVDAGKQGNDEQMSRTHDRTIEQWLDELARYETVSGFSHAFYELLADYLSGADSSSAAMRAMYRDYLAVEARYHGTLAAQVAEETVDLKVVRAAAEKREIGMRSMRARVDEAAASGAAEVGRALIAAQCCYHLGLTDRVIDRLEQAIGEGTGHPLVQFALGYNRYQLAVETFVRRDGATGKDEVLDEDRFRMACLGAVSAFQGGLSGTDFDGQLHWWIATALRSAGFGEAADVSVRRAAEVIGDGAGWDDGALFDDWSDEDDEGPGPISVEEIEQAAAQFRRGSNLSDLD